jgi:hypothetical protein
LEDYVVTFPDDLLEAANLKKVIRLNGTIKVMVLIYSKSLREKQIPMTKWLLLDIQ